MVLQGHLQTSTTYETPKRSSSSPWIIKLYDSLLHKSSATQSSRDQSEFYSSMVAASINFAIAAAAACAWMTLYKLLLLLMAWKVLSPPLSKNFLRHDPFISASQPLMEYNKIPAPRPITFHFPATAPLHSFFSHRRAQCILQSTSVH